MLTATPGLVGSAGLLDDTPGSIHINAGPTVGGMEMLTKADLEQAAQAGETKVAQRKSKKRAYVSADVLCVLCVAVVCVRVYYAHGQRVSTTVLPSRIAKHSWLPRRSRTGTRTQERPCFPAPRPPNASVANARLHKHIGGLPLASPPPLARSCRP